MSRPDLAEVLADADPEDDLRAQFEQNRRDLEELPAWARDSLPTFGEPADSASATADLQVVHPAPWWYRLLSRWFPDRCREIPEAVNPERIVLRQFAVVLRYVYLQQFASSEDARWQHSHQWRRTFALGLWGRYRERRLGGKYSRRVRAPYFYTMGRDVIHQVRFPSKGHTSLFIGLWRDDDLKEYHRVGRGVHWEEHIRVKVKRI